MSLLDSAKLIDIYSMIGVKNQGNIKAISEHINLVKSKYSIQNISFIKNNELKKKVENEKLKLNVIERLISNKKLKTKYDKWYNSHFLFDDSQWPV